jgi:hypothetical protein
MRQMESLTSDRKGSDRRRGKEAISEGSCSGQGACLKDKRAAHD